MIIDSSALVAILSGEPDARLYADAIELAEERRMSAATWVETAIVIDGKRDPGLRREFDALIAQSTITLEPFTEAQARIARQAYRDYGKGSGHGACLNFGDCIAYALARDKDEPLLFKGKDFAETDIQSALP